MLRWIFCLLLARRVYGLTCWTCENARSNQVCNKIGYLKTCDLDQVHCQNEVRILAGGRRQINKQCKQDHACKNNQKQNVAGLNRIQCDRGDRQSVCRCCCNTDNCNGPTFQCGRVEKCEKPTNPENGRIICPIAIRFGTICKVSCDLGFMPNRYVQLICSRNIPTASQGRFTNDKSVKCIRRPPRCKPIVDVLYGNVTCTNSRRHARKKLKNFEGTNCDVSCDRNTFLFGKRLVSCHEGHWSSSIPVCVKGQCPIPSQHDHSFARCTNGRRFGSTCRYNCQAGFEIVGKRISTCRQNSHEPSRGYWTNRVPRCQKVKCPVLVDPAYGEVYCTNDNSKGSICTFTCNAGCFMKGANSKYIESECQHRGDGIGQWSIAVPVCVPVMCKPVVKRISHGKVLCSNDNRWGSSCTYKCNFGYDLEKTISKTKRIICDTAKTSNALGEWSGPVPNCTPVICRSARRAPLNGYVVCTNHNYAGSICTFRCKRGFDLDQTTRRAYANRCLDQRFGIARGEWDHVPASCRRRIYCKRKQENPTNGTVKCTTGNFVGSACRFQCDEGCTLVGKEYVYCVELLDDGNEKAEWTDVPPTCRLRHCPSPWFDTETVKKTCDGGRRKSHTVLGTKCGYSCKKNGYYAVREGSLVVRSGVVSTCLKTLTWSAPPPRCFTKTCEHLQTPQNGYEPICSNGNNFGSRCEFGCKYGFRLSHSSFLVCIHDKKAQPVGRWNMATPTCHQV